MYQYQQREKKRLDSTLPYESNPFSGTRGNRNGKVLIVGESWGRIEALKHKPFVGESGQDLEKLLAEARIPSNECFFTNVINEQPPANDMSAFFYTTSQAKKLGLVATRGLYPQENVLDGLAKLKQQILTIRPSIIIGFGNYSSWALTDDSFNIGDSKGKKVPTGIGEWRGSQTYTSYELGHIPFMPTYHPAAAMRTYAWRYMIQHDLRSRVRKFLDDETTWNEPTRIYTVRPSFDECVSYLKRVLQSLSTSTTHLVLDLETSIARRIITCVGLALDKTEAICIPFVSYSREGNSYFSQSEEYTLVQLLRQILSHPNLRLIGHNLGFDVQYITDQLFVTPVVYFDTMLGQHVLWPGGGDSTGAKAQAQGVQKKALYNCASLYCSHYRFWKNEGKDIDNAPNEEAGWVYNCKDCCNTFEVFEEEQKLHRHFGLEKQFQNQMSTLNNFALPMMFKGIRVNATSREEVSKELSKAMVEYDTKLASLIPEDIRRAVEPKTYKKNKETGLREKTPWYTSTKQQAAIFFDYLGVKPTLNHETKKPSLNKDNLPIVAQREPILAPLVKKLEIRRSLGVFHSTFAESELDPDGRMRCSYNVTGTDTFRFSSSENIYDRGGNLQNIPSGKENEDFDFPNMRKHFEPDIGYELAEADLSGADAQVVAWEANDLDLMKAFQDGLSVHIKNARDIFPNETSSMSDKDIKATGYEGGLYHSVKRGVHGTNYGASAATLATRLRWTMAKAEAFQENWFYLHPNILKWHNRVDRYITGLQCWKCDTLTGGSPRCDHCGASTGRTIGNKFGYRIIYFDRINDLRNKALAWCPQSTVAINCNEGAKALLRECQWVEPLLQVHDSIVFQYPIRYSDRLGDIKKALHSITIPYAPTPSYYSMGVKSVTEKLGRRREGRLVIFMTIKILSGMKTIATRARKLARSVQHLYSTFRGPGDFQLLVWSEHSSRSSPPESLHRPSEVQVVSRNVYYICIPSGSGYKVYNCFCGYELTKTNRGDKLRPVKYDLARSTERLPNVPTNASRYKRQGFTQYRVYSNECHYV